MSMQEQIQNALEEALSPSHLDVINESGNHNVPKGSESHFKVVVVSTRFETLSRIERHRLVNTILADALKQIHALSIHAYPPQEWQARSEQSPDSPPCRGGSRFDDMA